MAFAKRMSLFVWLSFCYIHESLLIVVNNSEVKIYVACYYRTTSSMLVVLVFSRRKEEKFSTVSEKKIETELWVSLVESLIWMAQRRQLMHNTRYKILIEMQPFKVEMILVNYGTLLDALTKYQTTRIILLPLSLRITKYIR